MHWMQAEAEVFERYFGLEHPMVAILGVEQ